MKYRVCRVQRTNVGWVFTLPLDTLVFDTVKEAYERLQKRGIVPSADNNFWIQEISDEGNPSEFPKPLPGLDLPRSGVPFLGYVEQSEQEEEEPASVVFAPIAERRLSDWEKAWGYEKPVLRDTEREPVVAQAQAPWANKRIEVTNAGKITVTDEKPTVDFRKKPEVV